MSVIWSDAARQQASAAVRRVDTATRNAIYLATLEIDRRLHADPANEGESRPGDLRITFVSPVAILFDSNGESGGARVVEFWLY